MSGRPSLDDYIDVAERVSAFIEKYPEGSLQTIGWEVRDIGGQSFVVYRAAAYRTPDDKRPGHGIAWEPFPGRTPYTKDSELMNAETAAWGRAIVAIGLTANRKIASKQEVRARQGEQAKANGKSPAPAERIPEKRSKELVELIRKAGWTQAVVKMQLAAAGVQDNGMPHVAIQNLTPEQADALTKALDGEPSVV